MRRVFVFVSVLFLSGNLFAQQVKRYVNYINVDLGAGGYRGILSASFLHDWRLGSKQRFGVGLGVRFTSFLGTNVYYITAPANLTSGSTSPLIFFKENITENIDSLLVKSPQVNALNLMINLDYLINQKLLVGFNIDAIGFSFGKNTRANYMNGASGKNTTADPTSFNILLISDNDQGTLNSELYVRYFLNDRWALKTSMQFLFTEYTTITKVQQVPEENDRFRNKSLLFSVGVSYKLSTK
jgi:hypothetical protein